jgi:hypothetical protein
LLSSWRLQKGCAERDPPQQQLSYTHSPVPTTSQPPHPQPPTPTPIPTHLCAQRLRELDIEIFEDDDGAGKDYGRIGEGDVVIFPAFGATVQEMQLFKDKGVKMVDTTCPWVAKVIV